MSENKFSDHRGYSCNSTAEALDERMKLIPPKTWLAIIPAIILLMSVSLWMFWGSINFEISGPGIVTESNSERSIKSISSGMIKRITVKEGETVHTTQILVFFDNDKEETNLKKNIAKFLSATTLLSAAVNKEKTSLEKENPLTYKSIKSFLNQTEELSSLCKYATNKNEEDFYASIQPISEKLERIGNIIGDDGKILFEKYNNLWIKIQEISLTAITLATEIKDFRDAAALRSPEQGTISQILKKDGEMLIPGDTIMLLRPSRKYLTTISAYIPSEEAGKIKPGQKAHVLPPGAIPDRNGYLTGIVRQITNNTVYGFPDTIRHNMGNADFAKNEEGMNTEIIVSIAENQESIDGLEWTLKSGKHVNISEGMLCRVSMVSEKRSPAEYIFPWIKKRHERK